MKPWRRRAWMSSTSASSKREDATNGAGTELTILTCSRTAKKFPTRYRRSTSPISSSLTAGPTRPSPSGPVYSVSDNFTKIWGTHSLKFGALYERAGQNDFDQINVTGVPGGTNNQNGRFIFDDTRAGAPTTGLGRCQCRPRPVHLLCGNRASRLHPVSEQHVRVVRPGQLEGYPETDD